MTGPARLLLLALVGAATAASADRAPLRATFSIVARDTASGELGVGVQSHWFSVGATVPWAEAGVAAVATQSFADPGYGPRILQRVRSGERGTTALAAAIEADTLRDLRQVLVIDARGNAGVYTGDDCIPHAGHRVGRDHVCAGNLLASGEVWERMSAAFTTTGGSLAARILSALEAGQAAGGDARGSQSAALLVVREVDPEQPWRNRIVDLRVEDHERPIQELRRLLTIHTAYALADSGDGAFARREFATALRHYDEALRLVPENDEILFWRGSMRMGIGDTTGAAADIREAIARNPRWESLIARIPGGIFPGVETLCQRLGIARGP